MVGLPGMWSDHQWRSSDEADRRSHVAHAEIVDEEHVSSGKALDEIPRALIREMRTIPGRERVCGIARPRQASLLVAQYLHGRHVVCGTALQFSAHRLVDRENVSTESEDHPAGEGSRRISPDPVDNCLRKSPVPVRNWPSDRDAPYANLTQPANRLG